MNHHVLSDICDFLLGFRNLLIPKKLAADLPGMNTFSHDGTFDDDFVSIDIGSVGVSAAIQKSESDLGSAVVARCSIRCIY